MPYLELILILEKSVSKSISEPEGLVSILERLVSILERLISILERLVSILEVRLDEGCVLKGEVFPSYNLASKEIR